MTMQYANSDSCLKACSLDGKKKTPVTFAALAFGVEVWYKNIAEKFNDSWQIQLQGKWSPMGGYTSSK